MSLELTAIKSRNSRKKPRKYAEKLEEKIKELRAKAEEEILSVLTKEQRTQLREMIGETFDFNASRNFESRSYERNRNGRGGQEEDKGN